VEVMVVWVWWSEGAWCVPHFPASLCRGWACHTRKCCVVERGYCGSVSLVGKGNRQTDNNIASLDLHTGMHVGH
jgi:hypothetical protein